MNISLIILAGGNSHRFGSNIGKPYQKLAGKSLIEINVNKARQFKQIKKIVIVYNKKDTLRVKSLKLKNGSIKGSAKKPKTYINWIKNIFFDSPLQLCEFLNRLIIPIAKIGINIILEIDVSMLRDTK